MFGKVTKYDEKKNFGFILGEDGRSYFIHKSNLQGEHIEYGYYVFFKPFVNDRSDHNAKNLVVIEAPERKRKHGSKNK